VLGEEYIHLAFEYADDAFNDRYAAAGTDRPVKLFINDYNTEQDRKGAQYEALVTRLLAADVPIDGVGHQFHVSVNTSIASLAGALDRFAGLGLLQEVTELDVTINPATAATRIRQGHFYRDAFELFRDYDAAAPADEKLFAATVWGLTDNRSWRSEQQPLLFDAELQAKPAYFGAVGDDDGLPPLVTTANVFEGDVAIADGADNIAWRNLPENTLTGGAGGFQLRWNPDHLTALVRTTAAPERIEFTYDGTEYVYTPGASGASDPDAVTGATVTVGGEHFSVVHLPHTDAARGDTAAFDVRTVVGGAVAGAWNSPGATGQLTLLEPLSYLEIPQLPAPTVDGAVDPVWTQAATATTANRVEGDAAGATAQVRTLWQGNTLYALFDVTDPVADNSNSDPWNQDSVELFLDLGNRKSGGYGPNDTQIRITADGSLSFGTGDAARQSARVTASATERTPSGYVVEAAIALVGESGGQSDVPLGGLGTFHGIDFQVNDGRAGSRFAVHTWAEPTGTGYQNTARWGVARLAEAPVGPEEPGTLVKTPTPTISGTAQVGRTLTAKPGTWDDGVSLSYQWSANGTPITGATTSTLTLAPAHRGATITVTVTGSKDGFTSVSKTSKATSKVASGALSKTPTPVIAGAAKVGRTLVAKPGTWDTGVKLAYQWKADGRAIKGATKATLTLTPAQRGDRITVTVTGTKTGYTTVSKTSKATVKVASGSLVKRPTPTISGPAKVGSTLTVKPGSWDRGVKLSYRWYADGTAIRGATKATLRLTTAERGERITVKVTASKPGYASVSRTSKATRAVRR
jgi:endo-1,4-beta-xylanase